jgi:hypothetical protein
LKIHGTTLNQVVPSAQRATKISLHEFKSFLERDDNSRATSGKQEVISRGGKKLQVRILNFSVGVLYEKFISEVSPGIGKTTFYNWLRKQQHIRKPRLTDRETCLCKMCANMQVFPTNRAF